VYFYQRKCCLLQFEKEKSEKQLKRVETERDSLQSELIQVRVEASKSQSLQDQVTKDQSKHAEELETLKDQKQQLEKTLAEVCNRNAMSWLTKGIS